ncbi:MAG: trypsin-like serine protease [Oligoflexales bacterium]|nr:trypsin-like serine protease [Oligoflexales bacterium]
MGIAASWKKISISVILAAGLVGCGSVRDISSELTVTNGKVISEGEYPEVILLHDPAAGAICTGTFIKDDTVLTAAHCTMQGKEIDKTSGKVNHTIYWAEVVADGEKRKAEKIAASTAIYRNPLWDEEFKKQQVNKYDLAIVEFPPGTAKATARISSQKVKEGDTLTIVGYGLNYVPKSKTEIDKTSAGVKRMGTNKVSNLYRGFIYFSGATETTTADGTTVNASMGDSGGPLFIDGNLAGITSGGGRDLFGRGASLYIDLQTEESKAFLGGLGIKY